MGEGNYTYCAIFASQQHRNREWLHSREKGKKTVSEKMMRQGEEERKRRGSSHGNRKTDQGRRGFTGPHLYSNKDVAEEGGKLERLLPLYGLS